MLKKGRKVEAACELDVVELWKGGRWKAKRWKVQAFIEEWSKEAWSKWRPVVRHRVRRFLLCKTDAWRVRKLVKMR